MDLYGFCFPEKTSDLVEEPSRGTESAYCQRHPKEGAAVWWAMKKGIYTPEN